MTKQISLPANQTGFIIGTALLIGLTGCVAEQSGPPGGYGYRGRPMVQVQASMEFQDDYVYYPGYETYYSQNRHEFVYRDGNTWVRRPEPRGITASVMFSAPSVRMDFHDSPEQHDSTVVQTYPRNWAPPGYRQEVRVVQRDDRAVQRDDRAAQRDERRSDPRDAAPRAQVVVVAQDDYVYYPGYETYYSQNRREYVYREGNTWVRTPQPRGVALNVLVASPSVRLDFHDSPEQHHQSVMQQYPRNWKQADKNHDGRDERKDDRKDERKGRQDDDRQ